MLTFILIGVIITQIIFMLNYQLKILKLNKELEEKSEKIKEYNSINDLSIEDQKEYLELLEKLKRQNVINIGNEKFLYIDSNHVRTSFDLANFQKQFCKSKEKSDNSLDIDLEIKKMKNRVDLYDKVLEEIKEKN